MMEKCCQENEYGRLQAEYQKAVNAYRVILMYAQANEEVTGKRSDEFTRAVFQARRDVDRKRDALHSYIREHCDFTDLW